MPSCRSLIKTDHAVWTVLGAKTAMPANKRLIIIFIPENSVENAGLNASAAAGASFGLQKHATALAEHERVLRTCAGAWRVDAGAADSQHKTVLHASGRLHAYAELCQANIFVNACACKHAALAAHTLVSVDNLKPH